MAFGDDSYVQDQLSKFPPCAYSLIGKCMLWPTWVLVAMPTFYCSSVYFQVCSAVRLTLSFCLAGRQCACQTGWSLIGDLARYQDPSFLLVSPSAIVHGQKAGRRGGPTPWRWNGASTSTRAPSGPNYPRSCGRTTAAGW